MGTESARASAPSLGRLHCNLRVPLGKASVKSHCRYIRVLCKSDSFTDSIIQLPNPHEHSVYRCLLCAWCRSAC